MEIKFDIAKSNDIPVLKKMWRDIFKDTKEYTELYFSYKFKEGNTFIVRAGDEIASTLYVEYTELCVQGKIYKGAYFCGIATKEKYRGKGFAGSLIEYAKKNIKKVDIIYLIPANKSLFEFYKGFGFKDFTCIDKIKISREEGVKLPPHIKSADYEKMTFFYENSGNGLFVKRNEEFLKAVYGCYENINIFSDGYIVWYMADKIIHLVEYSFEYEKAVLILKGLLNEKDISEGIIYKKWGKEPFSVCITDLEIEKIPNKYINLMLN